jgi:hypothetical protein
MRDMLRVPWKGLNIHYFVWLSLSVFKHYQTTLFQMYVRHLMALWETFWYFVFRSL